MNELVVNDESISKEFVEQNTKSRELAAAITLFRHQQELQQIENMIAGNKPIPTHNENKVKRAIIDNTVNLYRRTKMQNLSEKKKQCSDSIDKVKNECKRNGIELNDVITKESLKLMADEVFANDKFEFQRVNFAMNICLQDEDSDNEYIFGDDTLNDVSQILFNDEMRIKNIKDNFYENFKELSMGGFWERNKYFLIGAGISLAFISVLAPVAAAGSAVVTGCLAQIAHCIPGFIGIGIAKVTAMTIASSVVLFGGILAGAGIGELIKSQQVKDAFRQLKPNDLAALLAMKATLINYGMDKMDNEDCKKELDKCLASINDVRADSEYMLIVEKSEADSNKKKIQICNRFVNHLAVNVGI